MHRPPQSTRKGGSELKCQLKICQTTLKMKMNVRFNRKKEWNGRVKEQVADRIVSCQNVNCGGCFSNNGNSSDNDGSKGKWDKPVGHIE